LFFFFALFSQQEANQIPEFQQASQIPEFHGRMFGTILECSIRK